MNEQEKSQASNSMNAGYIVRIHEKHFVLIGDKFLGCKEISESFDLLRVAIEKQSDCDEKGIALGKITEIQNALKEGRDSKLSDILKGIGEWTLDIANNSDAKLAADAIKIALAFNPKDVF